MGIDEFFKKWHAMYDGQEHCSNCPILEDVIKQVEGTIIK